MILKIYVKVKELKEKERDILTKYKMEDDEGYKKENDKEENIEKNYEIKKENKKKNQNHQLKKKNIEKKVNNIKILYKRN
jgi:hypothetical protein